MLSYSSIPERVFQFFAADPHLSVDNCIFNPPSVIRKDFELALSSVTEEELIVVKDDSTFRMLYDGNDRMHIDRIARCWVLIKFLEQEIPRTKLRVLSYSDSKEIPLPYQLPAIADLRRTTENLVPLQAFQLIGGTLLRNGHAFSIIPPIDAQNGGYWLTLSLGEHAANTAYVRLDPYLHGPESTFPKVFYKIGWHGRPLDWNRISSLKASDFGKWGSDDSLSKSYFTDFVWERRGDEVHFRCEELPTVQALGVRGSRYFHAIYKPATECLIHIDGAIRIYDHFEWDQRITQHVKDIGKVGKRVKVFRIDEPLSRDALADICTTFFMWNMDLKKYFC